MDQLLKTAPHTVNFMSSKPNGTPMETIISNLPRLSINDQEKVLEFMEVLLEADQHKRDFDRLQRPLSWAL